MHKSPFLHDVAFKEALHSRMFFGFTETYHDIKEEMQKHYKETSHCIIHTTHSNRVCIMHIIRELRSCFYYSLVVNNVSLMVKGQIHCAVTEMANFFLSFYCIKTVNTDHKDTQSKKTSFTSDLQNKKAKQTKTILPKKKKKKSEMLINSLSVLHQSSSYIHSFIHDDWPRTCHIKGVFTCNYFLLGSSF